MPLGLRVTPKIKRMLDDSATASGRSQSQEAEFRIEQSFHGQQTFREAQQIVFGRQGVALIHLLARELRDAVIEAGLSPHDDWMSDPTAFDRVARKFTELLRRLRPAGVPKLQQRESPEDSVRRLIIGLADETFIPLGPLRSELRDEFGLSTFNRLIKTANDNGRDLGASVDQSTHEEKRA